MRNLLAISSALSGFSITFMISTVFGTEPIAALFLSVIGSIFSTYAFMEVADRIEKEAICE